MMMTALKTMILEIKVEVSLTTHKIISCPLISDSQSKSSKQYKQSTDLLLL